MPPQSNFAHPLQSLMNLSPQQWTVFIDESKLIKQRLKAYDLAHPTEPDFYNIVYAPYHAPKQEPESVDRYFCFGLSYKAGSDSLAIESMDILTHAEFKQRIQRFNDFELIGVDPASNLPIRKTT